jgi:hypothetical protein
VIPGLVHDHEVLDAVFSSDGRWIATAKISQNVRLWDARTGSPLAPAWHLHPTTGPGVVYGGRVELTRDGRTLLACSRGSHLTLFDLAILSQPGGPLLSRDDQVLLSEINAAATLLPGGSVEPLAGLAWLKRWQTFRGKFPQFHPFPGP